MRERGAAPATLSQAGDRRWNAAAWLVLAVAALLVLGPGVAGLMGLRYPTDGWTSMVDNTGAYVLAVQVTDGPSPLRAGDRVLAIEGEALRPNHWPSLPAALRPGQVLRYTLERAGQPLDVDVTLTTRRLTDWWRYTRGHYLERPAVTVVPALSFVVALAVFLLRPGSAAARYLLIIFSFYGPGSSLANIENHLFTPHYPALLSLLLAVPASGWFTVFFPSWILLALSLPVRVWPLTRWPRALPSLLYGLPMGLSLINYYLSMRPGDNTAFVAALNWLNFPILLAFLAAVFGSLGYHFRTLRDPAARAQLRWIAFGMGVGYGVPIGAAAVELLRGTLNAQSWAASTLWLTALLPVCLAVAILRYRLWDIDVLIRRTLVYSTLTLVLALAYFGTVLVLESVSRLFTGQGQSSLVVVVSTLAIAALFVPVRARVQAAIDRRFFRRKYDAAQTLAGFAAGARDEVDLESLSTHLIKVVDETMQPASVGLWLRPPLAAAAADAHAQQWVRQSGKGAQL